MTRGTPPKLTRVRDVDGTRRQAEFTRLAADGQRRGPDLPEGIAWPEQTVALYEALRRDPVSQALTDADWQHVIDTCSLHRHMWDGDASLAVRVSAEVRLRLAQLGVTPEARLRLRMLIAEPDDNTTQQTPRVTAERKARLSALANG